MPGAPYGGITEVSITPLLSVDHVARRLSAAKSVVTRCENALSAAERAYDRLPRAAKAAGQRRVNEAEGRLGAARIRLSNAEARMDCVASQEPDRHAFPERWAA